MKNREDFDDHPAMGLIRKLQAFWVDWSHVSGKRDARDIPDYEQGIVRDEEADLDRANVVSSLRRERTADFFGKGPGEESHALAIDIDIPAWLIPSSTPGHSHLYVDAKIPHHRYMALLSALADAGIIERGYADVSIKRGHSDLRLPWVEKGDPTPERLVHPPVPKQIVAADARPGSVDNPRFFDFF